MRPSIFLHPLILGILFMLLANCTEEPDQDLNHRKTIAPIVLAELPKEAVVSETISFKVHHTVFNGCGRFERQRTSIINENHVTVTFYAAYDEGFCTENTTTLETMYEFTPKKAGKNIFRFNQGDGNYLLYTLIVKTADSDKP